MRIIGICGPFGSRAKQLATLLKEKIEVENSVTLIEEEQFCSPDFELDKDGLLSAIHKAEDIIIVVGHFLFEDATLREALEIKVFMPEDKDSCLCHYLAASQSQSVTLASLLQEYEKKLKPANDNRINPSQGYADISVPSSNDFRALLSLLHSAVTSIDEAPKQTTGRSSYGFF
ncbi:hypothetical protein [Legionella oakridgensis]|uniref:Uridine kinase n=2 Tax=Legionella oakridgensis TaxID=29423 RepID=W0BBJ0_9GAMM|nr:hypothetical protein [Legionella oakridgensis]AHE66071.1 uridine kinase [Legionella oakridgensis ATCC 33761 = DSM 21215]ETO94137.1 uridine kinase [Legionella oakridgensis RV-2-2007]KTD43824.1 uridine kinase [Legionella oakridgensis]STY15990.1 uridine kinase [Legionella longbeachae]